MVSESHANPDKHAIALHKLAVGSTAFLVSLGGDAQHTLKLAEAGFVPGCSLRVVRRAPLGSPIEVEVDGARFSLRAATAMTIMVHPA